MRAIDIRITKGKLESFSVKVKEDLPEVTATIGLFTDMDQQITSFSVSTERYYGTSQFDLPVEMVFTIKEMAKQLEKIVISKAQESTLQLAAPEGK